MKKKLSRAMKVFLVLLFVLSSLQLEVLAPAAQAVTQKEIDALKNDASSYAQQRKALQAEIDKLKDDKEDALAKKALLDQQSAALASQIAAIEGVIANYDLLIEQTEAELAETEEKERAQYALFCKRVRAMEENGTVSYWSILFKSEDFTDLLGRLSDIQEIMDYDQGVIDTLQDLQTQIAAKQAELEAHRADQEAQKKELSERKAELDDQRAAATALINRIKENEEAAKALLAEKEKAYNDIQAQIKKKEQELAAQLGSGTKGGYAWPVSSRYITSPYGYRGAVTGVVTNGNHKGVDIGRTYYTSEVKAAKAGVVTISQWNNSYGNYVVVSHGTGYSTLYAHMSSRKVTVGQKVSQGQVLGITGATGNVNGPHLHFEIRENGQLVDPLKYLTNYIRGNW